MNKKIFSLIIIISVFLTFLVGCDKEENIKFNREVIVDGSVKISALVPSGNDVSNQIKNGITFANSLADSVKLNDSISVDIEIAEYTDSNDVSIKAQSLVDNGSSLIIYSGDDYNTFFTFTNFVNSTEIPVISLSPYTYEASNFYSLTLTPDYLATCVSTYASENNYKNLAIVAESSNDYYFNLLDTFKSTFISLNGIEPITITINEDNTTDFSKYDFLFLATSDVKREEIVSKIRSNGFNGEIMLNEIIDKGSISHLVFSNCSFISKYEENNSNNVATIFNLMYSKEYGVSDDSISAATAYGYDAYMLAFEGLKSFESTENSIFKDTTTPTTLNPTEITLSDFSEAINNTKYVGVTDYISFNNNKAVPTYIYVDNIIDGKAVFKNKYTFTSTTTN